MAMWIMRSSFSRCCGFFQLNHPLSNQDYVKLSPDEISDRLYKSLRETYQRKQSVISKQAFPVIRDVFEKQGKQYENIVVPITDGVKVYHILTNLEKAYRTNGDELVRSYEKSVMLSMIDDAWKEHLRELDDLRQSVQTATYEQKDPLLIYKFESFELFRTMIDKINRDVVGILIRGQIPMREGSEFQRAQAPKRTDFSQMEANKKEFESGGNAEKRRKSMFSLYGWKRKWDVTIPVPAAAARNISTAMGREPG